MGNRIFHWDMTTVAILGSVLIPLASLLPFVPIGTFVCEHPII